MNKKYYQKPELNKVPLVAEEAVLTGCKVGSSGSGTKCWVSGCGTPGSQCKNNAAGS